MPPAGNAKLCDVRSPHPCFMFHFDILVPDLLVYPTFILSLISVLLTSKMGSILLSDHWSIVISSLLMYRSRVSRTTEYFLPVSPGIANRKIDRGGTDGLPVRRSAANRSDIYRRAGKSCRARVDINIDSERVIHLPLRGAGSSSLHLLPGISCRNLHCLPPYALNIKTILP